MAPGRTATNSPLGICSHFLKISHFSISRCIMQGGGMSSTDSHFLRLQFSKKIDRSGGKGRWVPKAGGNAE